MVNKLPYLIQKIIGFAIIMIGMAIVAYAIKFDQIASQDKEPAIDIDNTTEYRLEVLFSADEHRLMLIDTAGTIWIIDVENSLDPVFDSGNVFIIRKTRTTNEK